VIRAYLALTAVCATIAVTGLALGLQNETVLTGVTFFLIGFVAGRL
jgi:hypothetical protein